MKRKIADNAVTSGRPSFTASTRGGKMKRAGDGKLYFAASIIDASNITVRPISIACVDVDEEGQFCANCQFCGNRLLEEDRKCMYCGGPR